LTERAELSIATRRLALGVILVIAIALRAFRLAWGLPQLTFFDSAVFYAMPALRLIHEGTWRAVSLVRPPAKLPNDRSPRSTQALERFRAWLARERIDAVLLTEWRAGIARREGRAAELDVIAALGDGRLGFQRTAESRTSFFTERLYTWADPSFAIRDHGRNPRSRAVFERGGTRPLAPSSRA
jgi:hypothetical protein